MFVAIAASSLHTAAQTRRPGPEVARAMLEQVHADLKNNYYDAHFHGVDIDARFHEAAEQMKSAVSFNQALGSIAWALSPLNDSHTVFVPPPRVVRVGVDWQMKIVGDKCYVTAVREGTDAQKQGLRPGDAVTSINEIELTRDNFSEVFYRNNVLWPRPVMLLKVRGAGGAERAVPISPTLHKGARLINVVGRNYWDVIRQAQAQEERLNTQRSAAFGSELLIWKISSFRMNEKTVDEMLAKARNFKTLVLDLRNNQGGYVATANHLLGGLFDHDVEIGKLVTRKGTVVQFVKTRPHNVFSGKLIVLIDSASASTSEIAARVIQLEKRGTVIGDRSPGLVMHAEFFSNRIGLDHVIYYGSMITTAEVIMADGQTLEHVGVVPDELLLPTAEDLAAGRDPVLSRAAKLAGIDVSADQAAQLFPLEWPAE